MTWRMFGATRGALLDSIRHYATLETALAFTVVLAAGAAFPLLFRRLPARALMIMGAFGILLAGVGRIVAATVETHGLNRNALFALVESALPRVRPTYAEGNWRQSPFGTTTREPLSRLAGAATGRNVVLIVLESTGAAHLKIYGAAQDPMPNLTGLAAAAVIFEHAYSVYPESVRGLVPILCSRYPAFDTRTEVHARIAKPSIAHILREHGYRTGLFHSGRFIYLGMQAIVENRGFEVAEDAGDIGGNVNSSFGVDEPATVSRMLSWIDGLRGDERFFLMYLPIAGHHPYETPEPRPFPERDEVNRYRNALFFGDAALGVFFAELKKRALFEKTLFVVFGDHGEAFGQHEGNYGHTMFLYEENVRVPYLFALPGIVSEQTRITRTASVIDTAPTILDLLGIPLPSVYQGSSLLDGADRMALLFTDYSLGFLGLRDGPWKFIDEVGAGRAKLFRLDQDPHEVQNVAATFPARADAYRQLLTRWSRAQKELILNSN
jgi:hypothetical protein